jgi:hypothetical protein
MHQLAEIHISLQSDGGYIFTLLKDEELIQEFGNEIDFEFDNQTIVSCNGEW